jgi:nucleotide-binding universal stress UspA family protein
MIKNILVPTDFSEFADNALGAAASIARKNSATIHLLHIVELPVYPRNMSHAEFKDFVDNMDAVKDAKAQLNNLKLLSEFKDLEVRDTIQYGKIYDTIATQIEALDIDMIVMGSHGASGLREDILGTNAERVVRLAECPVLTVKKDEGDFQVKDILFASNFYGEMKESFGKIKDFVELFDAQLHLLKVITPTQFEKTSYSNKLMKDFAKEAGLKTYTMNTINSDTTENGILEFCDEKKIDVITIETHGRKGINHLMNINITEDLVNHAKTPVLSIKVKEVPFEYGVIFPENR